MQTGNPRWAWREGRAALSVQHRLERPDSGLTPALSHVFDICDHQREQSRWHVINLGDLRAEATVDQLLLSKGLAVLDGLQLVDNRESESLLGRVTLNPSFVELTVKLRASNAANNACIILGARSCCAPDVLTERAPARTVISPDGSRVPRRSSRCVSEPARQ